MLLCARTTCCSFHQTPSRRQSQPVAQVLQCRHFTQQLSLNEHGEDSSSFAPVPLVQDWKKCKGRVHMDRSFRITATMLFTGITFLVAGELAAGTKPEFVAM